MYRKKAIIVGILLAGCILINGIGHAATINANSCSQSAVQTAINSATTGDTVIIPSGICAWSESVLLNKNITIQGAGSGVGGTKLQRSSGQFFISNSGNPRITGIHFEASGTADFYIQIKGTDGWRIDNCRIQNTTTNSRVGVYVRFNSTDGQPVGLIDNNTFNNCRIYVQCALITAYNPLMNDASLLGSANTVFIEDNTMDRTLSTYATNVVDLQYGASCVYRFNTVINGHIEVHASDLGSLEPNVSRSGRYWEIYENSMSHPSSVWDRAMLIRGGTGVIFNNEITDAGFDRNIIDLDNKDRRSSQCNGTYDADGNIGSGDSAGWPCRDQIGRATDQFLWVSGGAVPSQASEPAYFWNNSNFENTAVSTFNDVPYIVQSRDYYEDDDSHMRSGIWANRPKTCTEGDGYWATDQGGNWEGTNATSNDGALYVCNDSNTFVLYYTPYTYPHPSRGGLPAKPNPPQNFRELE